MNIAGDKRVQGSDNHSRLIWFSLHPKMDRKYFFTFLFSVLCCSVQAQNEHFLWLGLDAEPLPSDSIDTVPYSGELNEFDGGYAIGDTVGDFHLWSMAGEEFLLSNEVDPEKPTIIFNGSATCIRFQNDWDPSISPAVIGWVMEHLNEFNWIPVYVAEAHALDIENCPSNCPAFPIAGPDGQYLNQHRIVQDRIDAAQMVIDNMGPGSDNQWQFPWDDFLIDSPDNLIYTHFFLRPAGMVVFDCDGIVVDRADWLGIHLNDEANRLSLEALLQAPVNSETGCLLVANSEAPCSVDAPDSDGDGTCDAAELELGTDPFNPCDLGTEGLEDSDGDGACDALELYLESDPNNPCDPFNVDTDGDGYCDMEEELLGSNPFNACSPAAMDSDGDGYCDSEEAILGSDANDPCSPDFSDSDMDGICNSAELANGSDPNNTCDPLGEDSDGDGLCDQLEAIIGSNIADPCDPYEVDTDGDGFCDILENQEGWNMEDACDPNDLDVDGDGWCAGMESASGWSDMDPCLPISTDSDGDGLCDMEEIVLGSDPEDICSPQGLDTDGDGWCDQYEIQNGTSPYSAESTLGLGDATAKLSINMAPGGFSVQCEDCLGQPWSMIDISGREVSRGSISSWNPVAFGEGVYILRLPEMGFQERLIFSH